MPHLDATGRSFATESRCRPRMRQPFAPTAHFSGRNKPNKLRTESSPMVQIVKKNGL